MVQGQGCWRGMWLAGMKSSKGCRVSVAGGVGIGCAGGGKRSQAEGIACMAQQVRV